MQYGTMEWSILVRGRPIAEYPCGDEMFVEGREGSEYEIEVHNRGVGRVEAVLSVDGLSVLDGTAAGAQSRGYLIAPRSRVRIPGWKIDGSTAAAFVFAGRSRSYVEQAGGDVANRGVIGLLAYAEESTWVNPSVQMYHTNLGNLTTSTAPSPLWNGLWNGGPYDNFTTAGIAANGAIGSVVNNAMGASAYAAQMAPSAETMRSATLAAPESAALGTGFGASTAFHTRETSFRRGLRIALMSLRYDSAKALRARGIDLRRALRPAPAMPNPFPGLPTRGCTPPPGWQG